MKEPFTVQDQSTLETMSKSLLNKFHCPLKGEVEVIKLCQSPHLMSQTACCYYRAIRRFLTNQFLSRKNPKRVLLQLRPAMPCKLSRRSQKCPSLHQVCRLNKQVLSKFNQVTLSQNQDNVHRIWRRSKKTLKTAAS